MTDYDALRRSALAGVQQHLARASQRDAGAAVAKGEVAYALTRAGLEATAAHHHRYAAMQVRTDAEASLPEALSAARKAEKA